MLATAARIPIALLVAFCAAGTGPVLQAQDDYQLPRCTATPLPGRRAALAIDGATKTVWRFGEQYPRPFFYPLAGPSGASLTRMGHPGAPNHDHHRSIWLAHNDVAGVDFWSDNTQAVVRQKQWYAYEDGDDETVMATALSWSDGEGKELMQQDLVAALRPLPRGEHALEIQITMRPGGSAKTVALGKTNFGFLAVRVAKSLSVHFGGGTISDSEGRTGEKAIFGQRARWVDYSGPVAVGKGDERTAVVEGITYFDHPDNPRYPTHWHVREDGWMGAAFCLEEGYEISADAPLTLRYLLYAHSGGYDAQRSAAIDKQFAQRTAFQIRKSSQPHRQYEVTRSPAK